MKNLSKLLFALVCTTILCSCDNGRNSYYEDVTGQDPNISDYELHYTSRSGYVVELKDSYFDAPIVSNTYYIDHGVVKFATPLTRIYYLEGDITTITIPSSVEMFGYDTTELNPFRDCEYLSNFNCKYASSNGFTIIKDNKLIAYARNSRQDSFTIPNRVTEIGDGAFYNCQYLKNIKMHDNIVAIGDLAFAGCSTLKDIVFPKKLKSLPEGVCQNCSELQTVTLPDQLECQCDGHPCCQWDSFDFYNCNKLNKFIGYNTTSDGKCLVINNIIHAFAPAYLDEYTIPDHIEAIACSGFYMNDRIEAIYIPSSVKYIGSSAFAFCHNLQDIYCEATNPPVLGYPFNTRALIGASSPFHELPYNYTIYVPKSSLNSYLNAEGWEQFRSHIVGYNF